MLVLTRKREESVVIGSPDDPPGVMKVIVLSIHGNRVKLGFDLEAGIEVERLEVWHHKHGGTLTERTMPVLSTDPFARTPHRWDAVSTPGVPRSSPAPDGDPS